MDEVVFSNEIEGVYSTRRQIRDALDAARSRGQRHAPYLEFAHLYLGLTEGDAHVPAALEELGEIYDAVVGETAAAKDAPDAGLFRADAVDIYRNDGRVVHEGVAPERIRPLLRQMLALAHADGIPAVFSAALCHFLFEYIHPFYDGNGRTGRYLLALQLSEALSQPTVLSLSRVIAENKAAYYRAFQVVERPMNRSDATPFVLMICDLLQQAQDTLVADLEEKRAQIDAARRAIERDGAAWSDRARDILFYCAQRYLFDLLQEVSTNDIASYLAVSSAIARSELKRLADEGLLVQTAGRPLTFVLGEAAVERFGLDVAAARP